MELARLGAAGEEVPVAIVDGTHFDLRSLTQDIDGAFLAADGVAKVRRAISEQQLEVLEGAVDLRIGAPIARPQAVVCVGMNYAAHARESGSEPPEVPVIFFKMPSTVVGPDDPIELPPYAHKADWEVELGIVIGKPTFRVESAEAGLEHIAGYVTVNDLSERSLQIEVSGGQWSKGKNLPGFCPTGPWLRPADEVDAGHLGLRSWVNGEPRQDSNTDDLIFGIGEIIHQLSQAMAFEPGDLILTGTPQGVALSGDYPYLQAGDLVEIEVDGLGRQRQLVTVSA